MLESSSIKADSGHKEVTRREEQWVPRSGARDRQGPAGSLWAWLEDLGPASMSPEGLVTGWDLVPQACGSVKPQPQGVMVTATPSSPPPGLTAQARGRGRKQAQRQNTWTTVVLAKLPRLGSGHSPFLRVCTACKGLGRACKGRTLSPASRPLALSDRPRFLEATTATWGENEGTAQHGLLGKR